MIVSRLRDSLRRVPPTNNLFRKTKIYAIGLSSASQARWMASRETRMEQGNRSRRVYRALRAEPARRNFFI
jgi:hypothetical protein